ncbi:hypothetical protein BGZ54_004736, partial [Gamsiella multidivaricata]
MPQLLLHLHEALSIISPSPPTAHTAAPATHVAVSSAFTGTATTSAFSTSAPIPILSKNHPVPPQVCFKQPSKRQGRNTPIISITTKNPVTLSLPSPPSDDVDADASGSSSLDDSTNDDTDYTDTHDPFMEAASETTETTLLTPSSSPDVNCDRFLSSPYAIPAES